MVPGLVTASRWAPARPRTRAADPVPHDAGAQLAELLGRVAAGEQVEHGVQHVVGQLGERGGAAHERGEVVDGPLVDRGHGDDLLGEHVEGVAGVAGGLDEAVVHAAHDHGGLDEVAAVLGEQRAAEGSPTWWPARPMRCRPRLTAPGEETCTTRSTAPMSMPSSSDEVATSPRSCRT
jgi:hypothetical protein